MQSQREIHVDDGEEDTKVKGEDKDLISSLRGFGSEDQINEEKDKFLSTSAAQKLLDQRLAEPKFAPYTRLPSELSDYDYVDLVQTANKNFQADLYRSRNVFQV